MKLGGDTAPLLHFLIYLKKKVRANLGQVNTILAVHCADRVMNVGVSDE